MLPQRLSRRAALTAEGRLNEKANDRFDATALAAISRIFAREAALKVAEDGLRWVAGAGGVSDAEMAAFEVALNLPAIHRAQSGLIADMDYIADVLYNRVAKRRRTICPGRGREIRNRHPVISQRPNVSPKETGAPSWKTLLIER